MYSRFSAADPGGVDAVEQGHRQVLDQMAKEFREFQQKDDQQGKADEE